MESVKETALLIRNDMRKLVKPLDGADFASWVNARINQYAMLTREHGIEIEKIYVHVNEKNQVEASALKLNNTIEIELWEDVNPGTYRIEFETSNPYLDAATGVFQGITGDLEGSELTWVLWQTDKVDVVLSSKIAEKLV